MSDKNTKAATKQDAVQSFGCRLNSSESAAIKDILQQSNLQDDVFVINSCAVTNQTESDIIRFVKKLKRENPDKKIIFTGCGSQANPQKYNAIAEIDFLIGNAEKTNPEVYRAIEAKIKDGKSFDAKSFAMAKEEASINQKTAHQDKVYVKESGPQSLFDGERAIVNDIMSVKETAAHLVNYFDGKTRAFVQIQNGCNHRCTFCIIPFGRGNSRSVPLGDIVNQINTLTANGYKEVVLTGVDITDYGLDLPNKITLGMAIRRILDNCKGVLRLRLSSVDVAEIDDEIFKLLRDEPRFMPYFHISLQSGDDGVLKQMARRHTRTQVLSFCKKVRDINPDALFGSDIIAGFPTESYEALENSRSIIEEADICFNHIFTFSPKKGTPAAKMKQLTNQIKKSRTHILLEQDRLQKQKMYQKFDGRVFEVLTESAGIARAANFAPFKLTASVPENTIIKITTAKDAGILLNAF
jgi:threonylcarbamoyladenosine tRNA methylthiotransferase MtaB